MIRAIWSFLKTIKSYIVYSVIGVCALFLVVIRAFYKGKKAAVAEQQKKDLENIKARLDVNKKVNKKSGDSIRSDLSKWVRDDKK